MKNSRLRQDLHISINDRVILLFREGFIFMKLRICECRENKVLAKISEPSIPFPQLLIVYAVMNSSFWFDKITWKWSII